MRDTFFFFFLICINSKGLVRRKAKDAEQRPSVLENSKSRRSTEGNTLLEYSLLLGSGQLVVRLDDGTILSHPCPQTSQLEQAQTCGLARRHQGCIYGKASCRWVLPQLPLLPRQLPLEQRLITLSLDQPYALSYAYFSVYLSAVYARRCVGEGRRYLVAKRTADCPALAALSPLRRVGPPSRRRLHPGIRLCSTSKPAPGRGGELGRTYARHKWQTSSFTSGSRTS